MKIDVPYNIGDCVYELNKAQGKIETKKIKRIEIHIGLNGYYVMHIEFEICGFCLSHDFGKTVFTDYAEAMHALNEHLNRKKT